MLVGLNNVKHDAITGLTLGAAAGAIATVGLTGGVIFTAGTIAGAMGISIVKGITRVDIPQEKLVKVVGAVGTALLISGAIAAVGVEGIVVAATIIGRVAVRAVIVGAVGGAIGQVAMNLFKRELVLSVSPGM